MSARRALGVLLLAATYAPLHLLLDPERAGPAAAATRAAARSAWDVAVYGTLMVAGLAYVLSRLRTAPPGEGLGVRIVRRIEAPPALAFALGVAVVAFLAASVSALLVHGGLPTSVDEMAQLLHARALAAGRLAVPLHGSPAAFVIQNGIVTADGWASIYPPVHTAALALGLLAGIPWAVGPTAVAIATLFVTLTLERLQGPMAGRLSGVLLAVTPFWIVLGSTHLSHATAAAGLALVAWSALRARDGGLGWAVGVGAAVGMTVGARPWVGLVCSAALVVALWTDPDARRSGGLRWWLARGAAVVTGGVPFAGALLWWNRALFGAPLRLGYSAAFGPTHDLGLHRDPWGNLYGAREAIAYTGADLLQLATHLLHSPLPALVLVSAALLLARPGPALRACTAWVVAAVAADALYWHHGIHFGPRMLFESTPAWIALFVSGAGLLATRPEARGMGRWAVWVTMVGAVVLVPGALLSMAGRTAAGQPEPPALEGPAVVFVHGSWASRVGARLAAEGMRRDSIETALRRNDLCAVDRHARWRSGLLSGEAPPLDLEALPGSPRSLTTRELSPGNFGRFAPDGARDATCEREAASDRLGALELEPLIWRMPPLGGAALVARDLGPAANAALIERLGVAAYVLVSGDVGGGTPRLLDYERGMELLWRGAAGSGTGGADDVR